MNPKIVIHTTGKFFRHPFLVLIPIFLICLILQCGYLESVVSPVESSATTLSGRVVDHLSKEGITRAKITLSGLRDTVVDSKDNGLFQFPLATTGMKHITVEAEGYHQYQDSIDLLLDPNLLDSIFIKRHNHAPTIHGMIFPNETGTIDTLPVTIQFSWTVSDVDFANTISKERLKYLFYFGETNLALIDSGTLNMNECILDITSPDSNRYIVYKPDSLISGLKTGTLYKWKIVVKDIFNDSSVYPVDSFITRQAFTEDSCPSGMVLVEMDTFSFCMDKHEFTLENYYMIDDTLLVRDTVYKYLIDGIVDTVVFLERDEGIYQENIFLAADTIIIDSSTLTGSLNTIKITNRYIDSLPRYSHPDSVYKPVLDRTYYSAKEICRQLDKRLCKISEWQAASGGYKRLSYPYGNTYDSTKCHTTVDINVGFGGGPVDVGTKDSCVSPYGIYDLSGNVAEWVNCKGEDIFKYPCFEAGHGFPLHWFAGGFWSSMENSGTLTINSTFDYNQFIIGFRCCKDIK